MKISNKIEDLIWVFQCRKHFYLRTKLVEFMRKITPI